MLPINPNNIQRLSKFSFVVSPTSRRVVSRCIRFDPIDEGRDRMIVIWYVNIFLVTCMHQI
jgi:hypothetical protein